MAKSLQENVDPAASAVTCRWCDGRCIGTRNGRNEARAVSARAGKPTRRDREHAAPREFYGEFHVLSRKAVGSMKYENRRKRRSSGRRGDRSEHGSEIRRRYVDPTNGESVRATWHSDRGHLGSRTGCRGGGLLCRSRLRARDRNSWVGAAAASSAAPATRRRYGRTFLCYVDPKRVFRIHEDVFDEEVACQDSLDIQRLPSLWAASPFCSAASPSPLNRLPHVLRLCCWAQETPVLRPTDQARQPQSS